MVGAGGNRIKEFVVPDKSLIIADAGTNNLKAFNYNIANKIIGTDANGNLVLKDHIKTIIKNFGGDNNQFTTDEFKFYDSSGNDITSNCSVSLNTNGPNVSIISISKLFGDINDISRTDILFPVAKQFVCNASSLTTIMSINNGTSSKDHPLFQNMYVLYSVPGSSELSEIKLDEIYEINESINIPIGSTVKGIRAKRILTVSDSVLSFYFFVNFNYTEGGA